jgi:hypothetical protein
MRRFDNVNVTKSIIFGLLIGKIDTEYFFI